MIQLLVTTHGGLAEALVQTAEKIVGKQMQLSTVCLEMHEGSEDLIRKLLGVIAPEGKPSGDFLVLADMFGGTPSNVALLLSRQHSIQVLTGVNLPMLLEAITHRNQMSLKELADCVAEKGRQSIQNASERFSDFSGGEL